MPETPDLQPDPADEAWASGRFRALVSHPPVPRLTDDAAVADAVRRGERARLRQTWLLAGSVAAVGAVIVGGLLWPRTAPSTAVVVVGSPTPTDVVSPAPTVSISPSVAASPVPSPVPSGTGPQTTSAARVPFTPSDLVGMWDVTDAPGAEPGTVLRWDGGWAIVFQQCGQYNAGLLVDESGGLVANYVMSGSGDCSLIGSRDALPWLTDARWVERLKDDRLRLLDSNSDAVAVLTARTAEVKADNLIVDWRRPPVLTEEQRANVDDTPVLPAGMVPATTEMLVGRWVPEPLRGGKPTEAYVAFAADGSWEGSDGCNGGSGRWLVAPRGRILMPYGFQTAVGCNSYRTLYWGKATVGFDGDVLVATAADGTELVRLRRA